MVTGQFRGGVPARTGRCSFGLTEKTFRFDTSLRFSSILQRVSVKSIDALLMKQQASSARYTDATYRDSSGCDDEIDWFAPTIIDLRGPQHRISALKQPR